MSFKVESINPEQEQIKNEPIEINENLLSKLEEVYNKFGSSSTNLALEKLISRIQYLQDVYKKIKLENEELKSKYKKIQNKISNNKIQIEKLKTQVLKRLDVL